MMLPRTLRIAAGMAAACVIGSCARQQAPPQTVVAAASSTPTPVAIPTPSPTPTPKPLPKEPVRGLYISAWNAGDTAQFNRLVAVIDRTELNAMVVDVKEDGVISWDTEIELADKAKASKNYIPKIKERLAALKKHNIYAIARITCFRDKVLPKHRPDLAIQNPNGTPWKDRAGHTWLDPYNQENWEYNVALAKEAASLGFDEIQWDYVRFPSEGRSRPMVFPKKDERSEARAISNFLEYARTELKPQNVRIAADVFGLTTSAAPDFDMGIGQKLALMLPHLDYVCPMVYPSHYGRGEYGIAHPNASPGATVSRAMKDGNVRLKGYKCQMRPWLQDFSMRGVRYGEAEVRAQIDAARKQNVSEYLLWNASNRYTEAALYPRKAKKKKG